MPPKTTRVAIYLRVSKDDGSQETDNQLLQLRGFCERWEGHELVAEYADRESGTRGCRERKGFDRMFADAATRIEGRQDEVLNPKEPTLRKTSQKCRPENARYRDGGQPSYKSFLKLEKRVPKPRPDIDVPEPG